MDPDGIQKNATINPIKSCAEVQMFQNDIYPYPRPKTSYLKTSTVNKHLSFENLNKLQLGN